MILLAYQKCTKIFNFVFVHVCVSFAICILFMHKWHLILGSKNFMCLILNLLKVIPFRIYVWMGYFKVLYLSFLFLNGLSLSAVVVCNQIYCITAISLRLESHHHARIYPGCILNWARIWFKIEFSAERLHSDLRNP